MPLPRQSLQLSAFGTTRFGPDDPLRRSASFSPAPALKVAATARAWAGVASAGYSHIPRDLHGCEKKRVAGKGIRKGMKTKGGRKVASGE